MDALEYNKYETEKKDFYVINVDGKKILYHALTSKTAILPTKIDEDSLTDELLYENFPELDVSKHLTVDYNRNNKNTVILMVSRDCNLKCRYCFENNADYKKYEVMESYMSGSMMVDAISYELKRRPEGLGVIIFYGGEPLLNFSEIKDAVPRILNLFERKGLKKPALRISTNATLITEEIAKFCGNHDILITTSLDGECEINDFGRVYKNEQKSVSESVLKSIELLKQNNVMIKLQAVVHKEHLKDMKPGMVTKYLNYLESLGVDEVLPSPVVTDCPDLTINEPELLEKLKQFAEELVNYYFDKFLAANCDDKSAAMIFPIINILNNSCYSDCNGGNNILIDTNGDIYPCHMFCGQKDSLLGNIYMEFDENKADEILELKRFDCETCSRCYAKGICSVWCKGLNKSVNNDMNKPIHVLCVFQKTVLVETLRRMICLEKGSEENQNLFNYINRIYGKKNENK